MYVALADLGLGLRHGIVIDHSATMRKRRIVASYDQIGEIDQV